MATENTGEQILIRIQRRHAVEIAERVRYQNLLDAREAHLARLVELGVYEMANGTRRRLQHAVTAETSRLEAESEARMHRALHEVDVAFATRLSQIETATLAELQALAEK